MGEDQPSNPRTPAGSFEEESSAQRGHIVDSQSIKTTGVGAEERGYDGGKKVKGRNKRHMLVDTEGFVLKVKVMSAKIMDYEGIKTLLERAGEKFARLSHLWLDGGYRAEDKGKDWVQKYLEWSVELVERTRTDPAPPFTGGFIYRFVPERPGDLSSGELFALRLVEPTGDRTGEAMWVPLDPVQSQINSDVAAAEAGATGYNRPEDIEITTSTGNNRGATGANTMYVSITGEDRVLAIDLREPKSGREHLTAFVSDYVRAGVNAPPPSEGVISGPDNFDAPDNLALDRNGNLYITEDPGGTSAKKRFGDDIFAATPGRTDAGRPTTAHEVVRFASLTDCDAEPTGPYFKMTGRGTGTGSDTDTGVNENSETL